MSSDRLSAAADLLREERAELQRRLAAVDAALASLEGDRQERDRQAHGLTTVMVDAPLGPLFRQTRSPSQSDRVLQAMEVDHAYTADEIIKTLGENEASIRSVLSRLVKMNQIVSPERGQYLRPSRPAPMVTTVAIPSNQMATVNGAGHHAEDG